MCRDLIKLNAIAARWLDGKCQRLLATALKVQQCWTLKTTVGDCWRQSPTCAGDSRQLKYKHTRECRRLSPSRSTVSDSRRLEYKPDFTGPLWENPPAAGGFSHKGPVMRWSVDSLHKGLVMGKGFPWHVIIMIPGFLYWTVAVTSTLKLGITALTVRATPTHLHGKLPWKRPYGYNYQHIPMVE